MACFQLPSARVLVSRQNIVSFKFSQKFPVEGTGSSKITLSLYLMTFYIKQKSFGTEPLFFSGQNVFITGGTGYLGRVLIHKLLTYCPDIGNLYLLMRAKKGVCQEKRLEDMKGHFLFQSLEKKIPGQLDKMRIVQGDVQEIGKSGHKIL